MRWGIVQRLAFAAPLALFAASLFASLVSAEEPPSQAEIDKLVAQLAAPRFAARRQAATELLRIGVPALKALQAAEKSPSTEQRLQAKRLVATIEFLQFSQDFGRIGRLEDTEVDVEHAMWLTARIVDPAVKREEITKQLDDLAACVREKLGKEVDPRTVDPKKAVEALREVLFVDVGFTGNTANYDDPGNSSIARVLAAKKGLPIILSEIVVAVGRRAKLPMQGLPWVGRYVVRYDGSKAPKGFEKKSIVLDPFIGGKVLTDEEILDRGIDPSDEYYPASHRQTVTRMLSNLASAYRSTGHADRGALVDRYIELVGTAEDTGNDESP